MAVLALPASDVPPESWRAKALVFEDAVSRTLLDRIQQIAPSEATVLITGETGTGKEIVARHVHDLSARRSRPFVAVNCGAFAETLIESDLFGHERGAFTGAATTKAGWFEAAHGGTLFLDEIGELPLALQVKLLRVLQEREVVRLGSRQSIPIDVRLIAATNANLASDVATGRFRSDLYYRLDVASLSLAPLRERPGDILPLASYFLELYSQRLGTGRTVVTPGAVDRLLQHRWPGNIRELENVIHHALVVCRDQAITADDIRLTAMPAASAAPAATGTEALEKALLALFEQDLPDLHARIEETVMRAAYRFCDRNQLQTARLLGISRNVVRARLIQCGELAGAPRATPVPRHDPVAREPVVIRIGYQKFGLLALLKARATLEAVLRPAGHVVEWVEYPGGTQLVEALHREALDLGVVGEVPPILAQAARAPIVYLAAEPPAPGAEAIVVHPDSAIRRVADLRGKTIALNLGANVDYLLIRALEEARVAYDEVRVAFVPPTGARAAFDSREVDAWAIWNPLLASVAHATGARVLRDGTGLASNTAYYVATRGFADAHPALVAIFLDEVRALGAWANDHTDDVIDLLAPALGIARPALASALAEVRFGALPIDAETVARQQEVADTFFRLKRIPRAVRISDARWEPPAAIAS